ncbi:MULTISPECIES: hypothetical protein [unclassified Tolypothrix]|uniref:hypothetical protein n=1 Tax=unclassified Tolypothrix TaxID=2649714 RepID=UPI0005EAB9B4|nr:MULTISPECIES: hypothetical protein [unclassified Tolypothrix]BAY92072.1 hypothetical protein NIES3275_41030 [Microchaete diplosiphon NIES-3275]EKF04726.1 hypothetical protein FDUTEX481_00884 [Tolypothrix sp. PCC 7601]MBE9086972.1 hypothetical protein [Tolypothrix sp. LEGE 11397]UYD26057.1 hypothetical protein HGR01_32920 [Tolypothrix sp. PCC 7712]UYD31703.1 hypothetical protein HG267_21605 [Tolypothrix sp. PCC 7601]
MNDKFPTDLQVSQELEALCIVINKSIDKAKNILEKVKEIDEVRELIQEIHLSREQLLEAKDDLNQHENRALSHLDEARKLQEKLQILQDIPNHLHELGINEDVIRDLQLIIHKINNNKQEIQSFTEESNYILLQVKKYLQESQNILQEVNKIKQIIEESHKNIDNKLIEVKNIIDVYDQKNQYTQSLIQELNLVIETIGGVEEIKKFIQDIRNTRLEMNNSEQRLLSARQQMIAVRGLENYLKDFQHIRNRKQLRQWLWNELGFVGFIVYFLSLVIPNRKK